MQGKRKRKKMSVKNTVVRLIAAGFAGTLPLRWRQWLNKVAELVPKLVASKVKTESYHSSFHSSYHLLM